MILGQHFPGGDPYFAKFVIALHQVICIYVIQLDPKKRQGLSEIAISYHTTITCSVTHGRRKVNDNFLLLLCKSLIREKNFKIITYSFNVHQNVSQIMSFHLRRMMVSQSNYFEAMKAGNLAILPNPAQISIPVP